MSVFVVAIVTWATSQHCVNSLKWLKVRLNQHCTTVEHSHHRKVLASPVMKNSW